MFFRTTPVTLLLIIYLSSISPLMAKSCISTKTGHLHCKNALDFPKGNKLVRILEIKESHLSAIPKNVFIEKKLTSLKALILRNSDIKEISIDAFNGLENLSFLDLTGNKLNDSQLNFENLSNLKILSLACNQLNSIRSESFQNLNNLLVLDLFQNNIVSIDERLLPSLRRIEFLDVASNPFNASATSLISTTLRFLRISLRNVTFDFFQKLSNLEVLDLVEIPKRDLKKQILLLSIRIRVLKESKVLFDNWDRVQTTKIHAMTSHQFLDIQVHLEASRLPNLKMYYLDFEDQSDDNTTILIDTLSSVFFLLLIFVAIMSTLMSKKIIIFMRYKQLEKIVNV
ncbi:hypothetical protein FQR65_LT13370 [Abscondita terminalis]|nr:hypothetical protein FQR65_LT13370 [Abscondita terminalis]